MKEPKEQEINNPGHIMCHHCGEEIKTNKILIVQATEVKPHLTYTYCQPPCD